MKKRKILASLLILSLITGCGTTENSKNELSNEYMKVDGIYLNEGYEDEDGLSQVVLFYTIGSKEENLDISSKEFKMVVNAINEYEPYIESNTPNYTDYYHSEFIEDVMLEDELKVAQLFKVPSADLKEGKTITLYNFEDYAKGITIKTEDIKNMESLEEISKDIDPTSYEEYEKKESEMMEPLDEATKLGYASKLVGYKYNFKTFVGQAYITYDVEFITKTKFKVTSYLSGSHISNEGTYEFTKGYVLFTYDNGTTIKSTWEENSEAFDLSCPFPNNGDDEQF